MATFFADLSHHQGQVDLAAYARAGYDRVALKATEGVGYVDPTFTARWRQAGQLGLARVAYHYARATNPGAAEYALLRQTITNAGGMTPRDRICLDVEDTATPARAAVNAAEFVNAAAGAGVANGLIYTGRWYADPNRITAALFPPGWRRLWLADYGPAKDSDIRLPVGWVTEQLVARQYTDKATVPGVGSPCDHSRIILDWLSPVTTPATPPLIESEEYDMPLLVWATGKPLYMYWPNTGKLVGFGDTVERDTIKKVHEKAGQKLLDLQLTPEELAQLIEFAQRVDA